MSSATILSKKPRDIILLMADKMNSAERMIRPPLMIFGFISDIELYTKLMT